MAKSRANSKAQAKRNAQPVEQPAGTSDALIANKKLTKMLNLIKYRASDACAKALLTLYESLIQLL